MNNIKLTIELDDDLVGCEIMVSNEVKQWEELDRKQQTKV